MYELLKLLESNARYTDAQLASMLGCTEEEVRAQIAQYEKDGTLRGYLAVVDWEKTGREHVTARIEICVTPQKDRGFEEIAEQIAEFEEVQSLYLVSGGYDLALTIIGRTFQDIATFVAYRLAPLESVQSTTTHFVLRKYKEKGVRMEEKKDQRRMMP